MYWSLITVIRCSSPAEGFLVKWRLLWGAGGGGWVLRGRRPVFHQVLIRRCGGGATATFRLRVNRWTPAADLFKAAHTDVHCTHPHLPAFRWCAYTSSSLLSSLLLLLLSLLSLLWLLLLLLLSLLSVSSCDVIRTVCEHTELLWTLQMKRVKLKLMNLLWFSH